MDNKTSGGNTKQIKRTSSPLVEGGKGRKGKGGTAVRRSKRVATAAAAAFEEAVKRTQELEAEQRAKTLLSIVNSFLDPFKKTFSFFFRPPPPMQSPLTSPPPPVGQKRKAQSISRISKSVINSIKNIYSLHDYNIIYNKDPILIDKILYDNNISEDDNNISGEDKKNIKTIFKRTYFEKDLLNNLIQGEGRIQSYTRNANNAGEIVANIFEDFNNEKVIADANTFFNKKNYCSNTTLKKYAPYFSIATQHDSKGINKCLTNKNDICYKCDIESDITLSKDEDGLLIIEAVKLKEGTRDGRYISYTLNGYK